MKSIKRSEVKKFLAEAMQNKNVSVHEDLAFQRLGDPIVDKNYLAIQAKEDLVNVSPKNVADLKIIIAPLLGDLPDDVVPEFYQKVKQLHDKLIDAANQHEVMFGEEPPFREAVPVQNYIPNVSKTVSNESYLKRAALEYLRGEKLAGRLSKALVATLKREPDAIFEDKGFQRFLNDKILKERGKRHHEAG